MRARPRKQARKDAIAATMATIWRSISLPAVHVIAIRAGWWTYAVSGGTVLGMPVDLYLGWAFMWGALPMLAFPRAPIAVVVALFAALDIVVMPACGPVVRLGDRWLIGEAVAIAACLIPAISSAMDAARTAVVRTRHAPVTGFSRSCCGCCPRSSWNRPADPGPRSSMRRHAVSFAVQILAVPAVLGISAVCDRAARRRHAGAVRSAETARHDRRTHTSPIRCRPR